AAAARQRAARRHEPGGPAAGTAGLRGGLPAPRAGLHAAPQGQGRHHRLGADQRLARQHVDREAHRVRPRLHRAVVHRLRPEEPRPDTVARLPQPERLLTLHGAVTLPRPVTLRRFELARAVLLAAFVVGLAASISLAQLALTGLLLWVLLARWQGMLGALRWPLWPPIAAFAAWTL